MSRGDLQEVVAHQGELDEIGRSLVLGPSLLRPHPVDRLMFSLLTCPRKYQLTVQGLFDVLTGKTVPLILEEVVP